MRTVVRNHNLRCQHISVFLILHLSRKLRRAFYLGVWEILPQPVHLFWIFGKYNFFHVPNSHFLFPLSFFL